MARTSLPLRKELDGQGLKFLGASSYPSALITRKSAVEPENLRGMKVRAMGQEAHWAVSLGASVIPIVGSQVPEALGRGTIEGIVAFPYVLQTYHAQIYCKFFLRTPLASPVVYDIWMNADAWRKIPSDLQKVYEETWRWVYPRLAVEHGRAEVAGSEKAFQDAGVRVLDLAPAQYGKWKASSAFLLSRYAGQMAKMGVDGGKVISEFEELYRKFQKEPE